jgi:hypothetical protein
MKKPLTRLIALAVPIVAKGIPLGLKHLISKE